MTTTTKDRAEINLRNAARSTGPTSPRGKERAKFNAVKHGLTAKTPVLPGEDPEAFQRRLEDWSVHLAPQNPVERFLVEQAVAASWKIERADRVETARLSSVMRTTAAELARQEQEEVISMGRRLMTGKGGPSGVSANDPLPRDPDAIVDRLESTAPGCRWLLGRWHELLDILGKEQTWVRSEMARAVRLVGRRRLAIPERSRKEIECELEAAFEKDRSESYVRDLALQLDPGIPADPSRNPLALLAIVRREMERLMTMAMEHEEQASVETAELSDRLSFDAGTEGERLRRYHFGCGRILHRSLDTLTRLRRTMGGSEPIPDASEPSDSGPDPDPVPTGPPDAPREADDPVRPPAIPSDDGPDVATPASDGPFDSSAQDGNDVSRRARATRRKSKTSDGPHPSDRPMRGTSHQVELVSLADLGPESDSTGRSPAPSTVRDEAAATTPAQNEAHAPALLQAEAIAEAVAPGPVQNEATDPAPVQNEATDPTPVQNEATDPAPAQNEATDPTPVQNEATDPAPAQNEATDPAPVQNEATDPVRGAARRVPDEAVSALALLAMVFSACVAAAFGASVQAHGKAPTAMQDQRSGGMPTSSWAWEGRHAEVTHFRPLAL